MRRPWVVMARSGAWASLVGDRFLVCGERHATPRFVERLDIDCDRLLRARLWKLYDEGQFGRLRAWGARALLNTHEAAAGAPRRVVVVCRSVVSLQRNPHAVSFAAASDCRTIAICEYTPLVGFGAVIHLRLELTDCP
jgi:hypothetical protein